MRALALLAILLSACGAPPDATPASPAASPADPAAETGPAALPPRPPMPELLHARAIALAARLQRELNCTDGRVRWLCEARSLAASPADPPAEDKVLLGIVAAFRPSQPIELAATRTTTVGLLGFRAPKDDRPAQGGMTILMPDENTSVDLLAATAGPIAALLRGEVEELLLPGAALRLRERPATLLAPLVSDDHGPLFIGEHPVRLYRLADTPSQRSAWVAIQDRGEGGFIGIFPDVEPKRIMKPGDAATEGAAAPPVGPDGVATPPTPGGSPK